MMPQPSGARPEPAQSDSDYSERPTEAEIVSAAAAHWEELVTKLTTSNNPTLLLPEIAALDAGQAQALLPHLLARLGTPGPEYLASETQRNSVFCALTGIQVMSEHVPVETAPQLLSFLGACYDLAAKIDDGVLQAKDRQIHALRDACDTVESVLEYSLRIRESSTAEHPLYFISALPQSSHADALKIILGESRGPAFSQFATRILHELEAAYRIPPEDKLPVCMHAMKQGRIWSGQMKGIFEPVLGIAGSLVFNELCHIPVDDLDLHTELQLMRCCATVLPSFSDHVLGTLANGGEVEKLRALKVFNLYFTFHVLDPALGEGQRYQITQANLAILKLETPPRLLREAIPLAEQSELLSPEE